MESDHSKFDKLALTSCEPKTALKSFSVTEESPCEPSSALHYTAAQTGGASKCWNSSSSDSSTTASSLIENDISSSLTNSTNASGNLQSQVEALKCKFHRDRKLLVKHLPRNVAKQEIAQLLKDFSIDLIHLSSNDDKSSTATVTLENPELLDEWNSDRTFLLRGQSVSVSPMPTEMVLCVAKLPFQYNESDFYELIKGFGDIKMYFLMISEKTGSSKGYGFVQYVNKESAFRARNALHDKMVDTFQLVCDWLDSSHLTFRSLHSTCLFVDCLPRQFRDMGKFRAIFERIVKPPYCQIALRNGCPLQWGLVEYLSPDDAELAQTSCNHYRLHNQPIRVVYFIPGIRAMNLMMNLRDMPSQGKSTGLLPDPTGQSIRMSIENLSKQNPIFAENLKSIILHQIQESRHTNDGHEEVEKPNSATVGVGKAANEPKTLNGGHKHHSLRDIDKIIPPTPPMTPTIINALPIMSPAGGVSASSLPVLPNTSVPPPSSPCLEKLTYTQPLLTVGMKDKFPLLWNDSLGQTQFTSGFLPTMQPATPDAAAATANTKFSVPPTPLAAPIGANFGQEFLNLPVHVQQNILNIINNSSGVSFSLPNMTTTAPPQPTLQPAAVPVSAAQPFPYSQIVAADPAASWLQQQQQHHHQHQPKPPYAENATLVNTPLGPSILTMPVGSNANVLQNWPSATSFMPTTCTVPVFTTAGLEWQNIRLHPQVMAGVPQPSTPVSHYYHNQHHHPYHYAAGQKRKLLPSPEKSPEGNYIGQHSQGIGGHYADSYFKKRKMF